MSYLRDPWLQIFGFLALASGALAAFNLPSSAAARPDAAPAASAAPPPRPAPAVEAAPAALTPKVPGKWVVDAAQAADADTAKLGEALAAAAAGDTIYVRAGLYRESVVVKRDVVVIGLGPRGGAVLDSDQAGATVAVDAAKASLKNVAIAHSGNSAGKAVESRRARLELSGVDLKVGPQDVGLDVIGGEASASDGSIEGGHKALDSHDEAKIVLSRMTVSKAEIGVYVQGAAARLNDTTLVDDKQGLSVSEQGQAALVAGEVTRDGVGLWANRGGRIDASAVHFSGDGTGVRSDENGRVELSSGVFFGVTGAALAADSSGEIDDGGSTIMRGKSVAVTARGRATLALAGTRIQDGAGDAVDASDGASVILTGVKFSGNAGAGLSIRGARAARVESSVLADQTRCAIEISGTSLTLTSTRMTGNLCGVAFFGQAVLDADSSVFSGNRQGPFQYSVDQKNEIVVRGRNNEPRDLAALVQ